jgi:hypothetical protein
VPISFIGGTPEQQAAITAAQDALADALASAATLPSSPALSSLVGTGTTQAAVQGIFSAALAKLNAIAITYDLTNSLPMLTMDNLYLQIVSFTSSTATVQLWSEFWERVYLDSVSGKIELAAGLLHELLVVYGGLVDFTGVTDLAGAAALAARAPASAATCAINYSYAVRPLLAQPPVPSPPGAITVASASTQIGFYQALNGTTIGSTPPLLLTQVTAPPLGFDRLAVFGEGDSQSASLLHAFDAYQGVDLWMSAPPQVSGSVDATPVRTDSTIWLCTGTGQLVSIDMSNPVAPNVQSQLTFMTGTSSSRVTSCLLSSDGKTLYAVGSMGVYALTLSGQPACQWSAAASVDFTGVTATLAAGAVIAASSSAIYAFTPAGAQSSVTCPAQINVLLGLGIEQVLVNAQGDSFAVVDTASQAIAATWTPGLTGIDFPHAALSGNLIFVPTASQLSVYAWTFIDLPSTWTQMWSIGLASPLVAAPVLWGSAVILQDSAGSMRAYDLTTGTLLWQQTGVPTASAPLGATAFVNEGDAALYPQAEYVGVPALVSTGTSPLPTVASVMPGAAATYALPAASGGALAEIYQPSPAVAFPSPPTSIAGWSLSAIGALMIGKSLAFDSCKARSWVGDAQVNLLGSWFVSDSAHQVIGPNLAMIDFNGSSLSLARSVVGVVDVGAATTPLPAGVQTALAMSGSTAQDAFQAYPGDLDFTQRVHISAATLGAAQQTLANIVLARATSTPSVSGIIAELVELKFGAYPCDFTIAGESTVNKRGTPIAWTRAQIAAGQISGTNVTTGQPATITWADAQTNPNWIKFDWIFSNAAQSIVLNTSNVLDPTWENVEGTIVAMDGSQDAFLQEIYLSAAIGQKQLLASLYSALGSDLRSAYIEQLQLEVKKFGKQGSSKYNLGKVAKRLYNLTRISGRLSDAVYLQGLFSSPIALVYQIWSRIKGVGEAALQTSIPASQISAQTQALLTALQGQSGLDPGNQRTLEADLQAIISALGQSSLPSNFATLISTCQADAMSWINSVFGDLLSANAGLYAYFQTLVGRTVSAAYVIANHPRIYEDPNDWN